MLIILYIKTFPVPQSHAEEKWKMENNSSQHEVKTKAIIIKISEQSVKTVSQHHNSLEAVANQKAEVRNTNTCSMITENIDKFSDTH